MQITSEQAMENALIEQLVSGDSQWTHRPDLRTEDDLWHNVFQKIEQNNQALLENTPLTDDERGQIKEQLQFVTFYDAAQFWAGENGVSKVRVQREDARLGTVYLTVHNASHITGGMSSYEVVNQCIRDKQDELDRNRRLDVTLLINGLPAIHIELKKAAHSYMDAFRQIQKYANEQKFTGIFSTVQMFVVSNGVGTRYIAPSRNTELNETFLTKWVDAENRPVEDLLGFAEAVLSIPNAHKMVTQYTVMNAEQKRIMLLRPYQIHAIDAVHKAMREQRSGYVWHTTGSGKTITSYMVARNLLKIPKLDKTLFVVDRKDLDQQTMKWFKAYAEHDVIDIEETEDVDGLIKALTDPKPTVIVTTVQKLQHLIKRMKTDSLSPGEQKKRTKLQALQLAFVVDECHRAVTAETQQLIAQFFGQGLWYGFTGTPIFKENQKSVRGDLPRTTEELYGPCVHTYTVKEAIHDKTVLGFQVEYKTTLDEDAVYDVLEQTTKLTTDEIGAMTDWEREERFPPQTYASTDHMLQVVDSIVNKSQHKLGFGKHPGQLYSGILTTSSISRAVTYYRLFRGLEDGTTDVEIKERLKTMVSDFPKVAITYSVQENKQTSLDNQEAMKEAIRDYNARFHTSYSLETLPAYNHDLNERLARTHTKYHKRSEQLDLVIVVDRLLTGFDAPYVSTLFVDRKPMPPHDLLQAFSRTNRILDRSKQYGQIVTFQYPAHYKVAVDEALRLYSSGGEGEVLAPTYDVAQRRLEDASDDLETFVPDLNKVDEWNISKKRKFVRLFQQFDKALSNIYVYSEYQLEVEADPDHLEHAYGWTNDRYEQFIGVYHNVVEELRTDTINDPPEQAIDIDYVLESRQTDEIDYLYILQLMQSAIPANTVESGDVLSADDRSEIERYIDELSKQNPALAQLLVEIWHDVDEDPEHFAGQNIAAILEDRVTSIVDRRIQQFATDWLITYDTVNVVWTRYRVGRKSQVGILALRQEVITNYAPEHEYPVPAEAIVKRPKIDLRNIAEIQIKDIIERELIPLIKKQ